ncbi:MAG: MarR family transcriptional regulator [Nitrososphaerota archaeon]|nr:MarR family transcriptional regulator [Nitrososphaerota archaeon]
MDRGAALGIASAALAVSVVVLVLKLVQPPSISIYLGNQGNSALVAKIPGLYSSIDVFEIFVSALALGISGTYILSSKEEKPAPGLGAAALDERKALWQEVSKTLKDDEMKVYQTVLDAGGVMNQGDLVAKSGLSKTTVSRTLDLLESKGLVEKRRRGMGNVVLLK